MSDIVTSQDFKKYAVEWRREVYARSPDEAASQALAILRDPSNISVTFGVWYPHPPRTDPGEATMDRVEAL